MENTLEVLSTEVEAIVETVSNMEWLWYGLQVAVVGMLVVFFGLVLLIVCIYLLSWAVARFGKKPAPVAAAVPTIELEEAIEEAYEEEVDDGELVAVISAAVAAMLGAERAGGEEPEEELTDGFVVRSIRRVGNAPAWNRAGREEQVYSRL